MATRMTLAQSPAREVKPTMPYRLIRSSDYGLLPDEGIEADAAKVYTAAF